jgi:hypothetical protein
MFSSQSVTFLDIVTVLHGTCFRGIFLSLIKEFRRVDHFAHGFLTVMNVFLEPIWPFFYMYKGPYLSRLCTQTLALSPDYKIGAGTDFFSLRFLPLQLLFKFPI